MAVKRQSPRHHFRHVLKVFDDDSGAELGHVGDATPEGLLLVGRNGIEAGSRCRLRLAIPLEEGDSEEMVLEAESRWSRHSPETDAWLTGFNIEDSPLNSRMLLASLIHDDL